MCFKKTIKNLAEGIVLAVCMICLLYAQRTYAEADSEAPTATNVRFSTNTVTDSTTKIMVEMDVKDAGTGVSSIILSWKGVYGDSATLVDNSVIMDEPVYDGKAVIECDVSTWTSVPHYLTKIAISDNAGNKRSYTVDLAAGNNHLEKDSTGSYLPDRKGKSEKCFFASKNVVEVKRTSKDPVLAGVVLPKKKAYAAGDSFKVLLNVTGVEHLSRVETTFEWTYDENVWVYGTQWKKTGNDTIEVTVPVTANSASGKYRFGFIRLFGKNDQEWFYPVDEDPETGEVFMRYMDSRIMVEGDRELSVKSNGDEELPVIKSITVNTPEITKPGIIKIQASVSDDTGIKKAECWITGTTKGSLDQSAYDEVKFDAPVKNRSVVFEIPMGTGSGKGEYIIQQIILEDFSGKRTYYNGCYYSFDQQLQREIIFPDKDEKGYCLSHTVPSEGIENKAYISPANRIAVSDEFDVAFEMGITNSTLSDKIGSMKDGESAKILFTENNHTAKKEWFEAVKGRDKTLIFYKNNYQWIFRGIDITAPKDVDLNIVISKVSGEDYDSSQQVLKFDFPENGVLPGKAEIRIKADYTYYLYNLGHSLYLYYLEQASAELQLEEQSDIRYYLDGTDHWCRFTLTHNSDFIAAGGLIKNTKLKKGYTFSKKKLNGVFRITGKSTAAFVKPVNKNAARITIPDTVTCRGKIYKITEIQKRACRNMAKLTKVTIGKNVKCISKEAFSGCKKLKKVSLGKNLSGIETKAFSNCKALKEITIPAKISKIGTGAFSGCGKLAKITFKTKKLSNKKVGKKAFHGISAKAVITVPKKVFKKYEKWLPKKGLPAKAKIKH